MTIVLRVRNPDLTHKPTFFPSQESISTQLFQFILLLLLFHRILIATKVSALTESTTAWLKNLAIWSANQN